LKPKYRLIAIICLVLSVSACQKAVSPPETTSYSISGDKNSPIYPQDILSSSEDVHIRLKTAAPDPQVWSYDSHGNPLQFNFSREADTLVIPGKFEHLQLRHGNDQLVDIVKNQHSGK